MEMSLSKFQGLDACGELDIEATLELFERTGKIRMKITDDSPVKLVMIEICNWRRYQSDLDSQAERARRYRERKRERDVTRHRSVTPNVTPTSRGVTQVDVELDVEVEKHIRPSDVANPPGSRDGGSSKNNPEHLQAISEVWESYLQKLEKNPKINSFTEKRRKKVLARLGDALETTGGDLAKAKGLLCVAVDALAASPFHRGENDRKRKYDSLEDNLFKSREQFENWLQRSIDGEGAE
jgi:hypothetical protein